MRLLAVIDEPFEKVDGGHFSQFTAIHFLPFLMGTFDSICVTAPCLPSGSESGPYLSHAEELGLSFAELPGWTSLAGFLRRTPSTLATLRRVARRLVAEADVVWLRVPSLVAFIFFAEARSQGRDVLLHIAGDPRGAWRTSRYPRWAKPILWMGSLFVHHVTAFMAQRSLVLATGQHLLSAYAQPGRGMLFVDMAIADEPATPRTAPIHGNFELLYVGRLTVDKGLPVLFQALERLSKTEQGRRFRLRVVGGGRDEAQFRAMVAKLEIEDRVAFIGPLPPGPSLRSMYATADALLVPSTSSTEGIPRVILEAFAAALPVIASRVGGIAGIVSDAHNGFLVLPGSSEELAGALAKLRSSPSLYAALSRNAVATAQSFTPKRQVENLMRPLTIRNAPPPCAQRGTKIDRKTRMV
jgi:glycosyltransferase involved in cell wall biosynthesis